MAANERMTDADAPRTVFHPGVEVLPSQGATRGVVVVLHGGKADSFDPSLPSHLSRRRMKPFAKHVHEQGAGHGVAVWTVQYRYRGWNGTDRSPVHDAQWALDEVRRRHGDVPVVLLGHSMGGRAAVHVLGDPSVVGLVGLCPWLPDEPVSGASGKQVLIAHAVVDRWTSPRQSRAWADDASLIAQSLLYVGVRKTGHFMIRRAGLWNDIALLSLRWLGVDPSVGRVAANLLATSATGAATLTL